MPYQIIPSTDQDETETNDHEAIRPSNAATEDTWKYSKGFSKSLCDKKYF